MNTCLGTQNTRTVLELLRGEKDPTTFNRMNWFHQDEKTILIRVLEQHKGQRQFVVFCCCNLQFVYLSSTLKSVDKLAINIINSQQQSLKTALNSTAIMIENVKRLIFLGWREFLLLLINHSKIR